MKISVVVPVYNGEQTIASCLEALLRQEYPPGDYEIVVVNDGSRDGTRRIVQEYPVRLINLPDNRGRIIARKRGAQAAAYPNLLFIDARAIAARDLLRQAARINYQPLMAGELGEDKYRSPFDTLFYLIRRKVYAPYYPQRDWGEQLWIDEENFVKTPKGTTCLFCSKQLFLQSLPQRQGKTVSDDTLLLAAMVKHKKILRHTGLKLTYLQRTDYKSVLAHIYQRGTLFNDYYLRGPSRYYRLWQVVLFLLSAFVGLSLYSLNYLLYGLLLMGGVLVALALFLAENTRDVVVILLYLGPVALAFLAGIIRGKLLSLFADEGQAK